MSFPTLQKSAREREYKLYSPQERAEVVYEYLFNGRSHRWLDANVLDKDGEASRGWQSMGILHHLGLVNPHKSYFKGNTVAEAILALEAEATIDNAEIIRHLQIRPGQENRSD